jgi:hypothetical protein
VKNRNGKQRRSPAPLAIQVVPPFVPALGQVEAVSEAAIAWALESGLSMPLGASIEVREYGFQVYVDELAGKHHTAILRFNRDGQRQMYERAR